MARHSRRAAWNWALVIAALSLLVSAYGVWRHQHAVPDSQLALVSQVLEVQEKVQTQIKHLEFSAFQLEKRAVDPHTSEAVREALLQSVARTRAELAPINKAASGYDRMLEGLSKRQIDNDDKKRLYNVRRNLQTQYAKLLDLTREVDARFE